MTNWIKRAQTVFRETVIQGTAVTDDRTLVPVPSTVGAPEVEPEPQIRTKPKPDLGALQNQETNVFARSVLESPTGLCHVCKSFLYWKSVHGAVVCVNCHPPSFRNLVAEWLWVDQGIRGPIQ
jgi:hypothetical protein